MRPIRTMWELAHAVQEMWTHFELEMVVRSVGDFPSRLQLCLKVGDKSVQS
jgi:hypothetical protein